MKKVTFLLAAALLFGLGPFTTKLGATLGALALVGLAMGLAAAASGLPNALAIAGGAFGALASGVLVGASPAAAGAALTGLCFAERTMRVRGSNARLLHLGAALGAGAIAGSLGAAYAASSFAVRGVAIVVGAVLVGLPLLVDADDPVAHTLEGLATDVAEPSRGALLDAAELRRHVEEGVLDRKTARQVRETWRSLLRLAEARARLERTARKSGATTDTGPHREAVVRRLDQRIGVHVAALRRTYTAADTAKAAEASLDDAALRHTETLGESFEQAAEVILEDV